MPISNPQLADIILSTMAHAWHVSDGNAVAGQFADDASYVDASGQHLAGKANITAGIQKGLDDVYKDSHMSFEVTSVRDISDTLFLAHGKATLDVASGPLAGSHPATFSMLVSRPSSRWFILAYHETKVQEH